mgnify:CR=1 FL=1
MRSQGAEGGKNPVKLDGIVPQIVSELFRRFASLESHGVRYNMWASFIEVASEKARDLLAAPIGWGYQPVLEMRTHGANGSGTDALNAHRVQVPSSRALTALVEQAMARRVTGETDYNEHSSRSHALLTLTLEKRVDGTSQTTSLLICDLAGSETYSSKSPHAQINTSLLALGRVLSALAKGQSHVPYRDSVLTRLLQGVLGGGGTACMLACINPIPGSAGETSAVLEYAKTTASIVRNVVHAAVVDVRSALEKEQGLLGDPMADDEYDDDDELCRRTEFIETRDHGAIHARCLGDSEAPLILYLHGGEEGASSKDLAGMVQGVAEAMRSAAKAAREKAASSAAAHAAAAGATAPSGPPSTSTARDSAAVSSSSREGSFKKANPEEPKRKSEYKLQSFEQADEDRRVSSVTPRASRANSPRGGRKSNAVGVRVGGSKSDRTSMGVRKKKPAESKEADAKDKGEKRESEAESAEADSRFFHLRAHLSSSLLRAGRELSASR